MAKLLYTLVNGVWEQAGGPPGSKGADAEPGSPGPPGPEGPQGPPGTAYLNSQWDFNQNTAVSPANGTMRMDATTYAEVTLLWISELDRDNLDRQAGLDLCVPGGQIIMQSAQGRAVWDVTSHADSGTYRTIGVTLAESSGSRPSAGSKTTLYFVTEGGSGGSAILSGTATPDAGTGAVGDYYLDTDDRILYGPKNNPASYGPNQSAYTSQTHTETVNISGAFTLGNDFTFAVAGQVVGLRLRRIAETYSGYFLKLWSNTGVLLAEVTLATGGTAGWTVGMFATPVAVTAGQTVRASLSYNYPPGVELYRMPNPGANIVNGDVTMIKQGYSAPAPPTYPTTTSANTYFVDVVFQAGLPAWPVALKSVPPGGTTAQVLAKTSASDYAADWSTPAAGLQSRATATKTTASLAAGASESGTIPLAAGYRLYSITTSAPARVRLYTTTAKRDSDAARPIGTDPSGDHGLVLEWVSTSGLLAADLSPLVDGFDGKPTPDGSIPYHITNTGAGAAAITCQFVWLRAE